MCPDHQPYTLTVPVADEVRPSPVETPNLTDYLMTLPEALESERDESPLRGIDFDCKAIEGVRQSHEKESPIAALEIITLGEKDRLQGNVLSAAESRSQLAAARRRL